LHYEVFHLLLRNKPTNEKQQRRKTKEKISIKNLLRILMLNETCLGGWWIVREKRHHL